MSTTPVTENELRQQLQIADPTAISVRPGESPELERKAEAFVDALIKGAPEDHAQRDGAKASVEAFAADVQKQAAVQSQMLKQPLKTLGERSKDGGEVANALIELKLQVEELDPGRHDLEPGWMTRLMGRMPFVGSPLKRYFSRYESAQTAIAAIIRALELGRDQLRRDNVTLAEDQKRMRDTGLRLTEAVKLAQLVDQKIDYRLQREIPADDPRQQFVKEELLYVLRQRTMDLQQQLAVHLQGVLATEMIMRNNNELVRGVERALNVTVAALQVAVTVAMALGNQKMVLDKIQALNQTTSTLIAGTAQRLRTQGVEIHKQASSAQLDVNALKQAFVDLKGALADISTFRQQALPQMAQTIVEMDKLAKEAEDSVRRLEDGNRARPTVVVDV